MFLEVQEVSCSAGGKQWAIGIWKCRRQAACIWIEAQDSKKISCDDPFQTVPGSIPGSCIPAFTGTLVCGTCVQKKKVLDPPLPLYIRTYISM